jgi:hypothetical protein
MDVFLLSVQPAFNKIARGKCTIYKFPTLQEATGNFSEKHKLGEGGFGTVYKVYKQTRMQLTLIYGSLCSY